jgi:hypothetical protein
MTTVSSQQPIASAYFVIFGGYGDVTRHAQARGVSRQWIYHEAQTLQQAARDQQQQKIHDLQAQLSQAQQQIAAQEQRLAVSVVLDDDKQAELASFGQARGVSLPDCQALVDVLIPGKGLSVATLGRRTQAAGKQAGALLKIFDEFTRARVRDVAADEIYVRDPVRMVVEQESLCWVCGRLADSVDGQGWYEEFKHLPNLEQVARDGGTGLKKGVALVNADRVEKHQTLLVDQGDHFHALFAGGPGLRKAQQQARKTFAAAEAAQQKWQECQQRGEKAGWQSACQRARRAWEKAQKAMDTWIELERSWDKTKQALPLITPEGELNTRAHAEQVLAETLPELPDADFAKAKRALQQPEMLSYLDQVQKKIAELPYAEEVKQAAVRQECLRRSPELLKGAGPSAAALRGVMLVCAVVLSKSGAVGEGAVAGVREIFRRAYRASSLVECINSVLRMQQSRHRKMTQGMLDLKRLYWNSHTFRTGRRRQTTPYQRLGVPWPEGMSWWDVLKLTPEQLRDKLSTTKQAA